MTRRHRLAANLFLITVTVCIGLQLVGCMPASSARPMRDWAASDLAGSGAPSDQAKSEGSSDLPATRIHDLYATRFASTTR